MKDIICPNCHKQFQVDESTYASIVAQVRGKEFKEEVERRLAEARDQQAVREQSLKMKAEKELETCVGAKDREISSLRTEIAQLKGVIESFDAKKQSEISMLEVKKAKEMFDAVAERERKIAELEKAVSNKDNEYRLKINDIENAGRESVRKVENRVLELQSELNTAKLTATNREAQLREQHKLQLEDKQAEIDRLRDFKMKLSTKMVGETLEQHCSILFAQSQSLGMFSEARFEKDNIAVDGTKGDFVFRDYIDGREYISIMFEMKNEADTTATKHRNEDFFDKLDKDRHKKNCEYAVLVSMLEQGNELYDTGIVDVGFRYPKMLVIRPQFFLTVIRLLTEASRKGFQEKAALLDELKQARDRSLDFTKFEDKINAFRTAFNRNVVAAHKKFEAATEGIDKTIQALEQQIKSLRAIKANFESSEQKLLKANELADENLTIKKLTHGNPSVRRMIIEARENDDSEI